MVQIKTTPKGRLKVQKSTIPKLHIQKRVSSGPIISIDVSSSSDDDGDHDDLDDLPARNKVFRFGSRGREVTQTLEASRNDPRPLSITEKFEYRVGNPYFPHDKSISRKDKDTSSKSAPTKGYRSSTPLRDSGTDDDSDIDHTFANRAANSEAFFPRMHTLSTAESDDYDSSEQVNRRTMSGRAGSSIPTRRPRKPTNTQIESTTTARARTTTPRTKAPHRTFETSGQSTPTSASPSIRLPRVKVPTRTELLKTWARLQAMISAFSAAGLFDSDENQDIVHSMQQELTKLAALLSDSVPTVGTQHNEDSHRQVFLCHGSRGIKYVLQAQYMFTATKNVSNKTYGYVRFTNTTERLMGTYSGWLNCTQPDPYLLDVNHWFKECKYIAAHYSFCFKAGQIDKWQNVVPGSEQTGHAEIRLALWFACFIVRRKYKVLGSDRSCYGYFHKLKSEKLGIEADILLSHCNGKPCQECQDFVELVHDITGITFHFLSISNVGFLKPQKTARNQNKLGQYASDTELHSFNPDDDSVFDDQMSTQETSSISTISKRMSSTLLGRGVNSATHSHTHRRRKVAKGKECDTQVVNTSTQAIRPSGKSTMQIVIPFSATTQRSEIHLRHKKVETPLTSPTLATQKCKYRSFYEVPTVQSDNEDIGDDPFELARSIQKTSTATRRKRTGDMLFEKEWRRDREDADFNAPKSRSKKRRTI